MKIEDLLRHVADNVDAARYAGHGLLVDGKPCQIYLAIDICYNHVHRYTLVPRTHEVNGYEVPAPLEQEHSLRSMYFVADPSATSLYSEVAWHGSFHDRAMFQRGNCFATREGAIQNAKAMLKINPEK